MINYQRPDQKTAAGYLAKAQGPKKGGVVVIQEWWGLTEQLKGVVDRLAAEGYDALAPDLYQGRVTTDHKEATAWMQALDGRAAVDQEVRGAVQHLAADGSKVAVLGFCMGGALTISAAVHVPELSAAVVFYGIPSPASADPAKVHVPLLAHYAEYDDWCSPERVDALEARFKEGGVKAEICRYDARHAFFNEARPDAYSETASFLAWARSLTFLERHLTAR